MTSDTPHDDPQAENWRIKTGDVIETPNGLKFGIEAFQTLTYHGAMARIYRIGLRLRNEEMIESNQPIWPGSQIMSHDLLKFRFVLSGAFLRAGRTILADTEKPAHLFMRNNLTTALILSPEGEYEQNDDGEFEVKRDQ